MSRTNKDLKSYHKGHGKYNINKQTRKLTPFILNAGKEVGKKIGIIVCVEYDISQDDYNIGKHWYNAKQVRAIRRQKHDERKREIRRARKMLRWQNTL